MSSVRVARLPVSYPTYRPAAPQKNPLFLEHRVYQGSSGRVYPLPVIDRIAEQPVDRACDSVQLENEFLKLVILPEIGGRIHVAQDKTNGYDLIYRQRAIKPALVGLAGPWLSGGIEFNWPQHHRPATFMPVDVEIEEHADGSRTVWLSDHDPMLRMKGMHGVCLHPGRAVIELKVRAYNRTPFAQTFLWWANVATQVHEGYQSFFPPDVHYVADHAKRAMSAYPLAADHYYGVNYGARRKHGVPPNERPTQFIPPYAQSGRAADAPAGLPDYAPNDLSWYANIPVPTSYMAMGSSEDFFGGYDHLQRAGLVHIANHHISPGKKQWTWGNSAFGYAWDRNLTTPDENGIHPPYIEIMAGVYTDNQPDFSFLQPGETKTWSQYWYPIREIGPVQHANLEAAFALKLVGRKAQIGVAVTRPHRAASLIVACRGRVVAQTVIAVAPDRPFRTEVALPRGVAAEDLTLTLLDGTGKSKASSGNANGEAGVLLRYQPKPPGTAAVPPPATEPRAPAEIESADQLYLTGLHLDQYRHATRKPDAYWREALRRDPGDARCNQALGAWHLRRGEFERAESHLRAALGRLTERNPNPQDGEPYYTLGLTLRYLGRDNEAYDAFYKATWAFAWQAPAFHALAEIDCVRRDWSKALEHLDRALRLNTDNLRARDLKVLVLRRLGRPAEADALLEQTLALDPLDWWAIDLKRRDSRSLACSTQTRLDLVHDYARAGFFDEALSLLKSARPEPESGTAPLVAYTAAWLTHRAESGRSQKKTVRAWLHRARAASPDYCFPARLEELQILGWAATESPRDPRAPYYLGNLLYDRQRYAEAIAAWEKSARLDATYAVVWRNLGIAYFNVRSEPARAHHAYNKAWSANPSDARLLFERDQLWKRMAVPPHRRLRELEKHAALVDERDDVTLEMCALYNLTDQPAKAAALLASRRFQPWEGGEGQALAQHVRAHLALGRGALAAGEAADALRFFNAALGVPENLGEARHPLANPSDIYFWLGEAQAALGDGAAARESWKTAATFTGDFQQMAVRAFSELTYYSALAWDRLGRTARSRALLRSLLRYARTLAAAPATVDYFATSLPTMLLFNDDLRHRQQTTALFLQAQAELGLGQRAQARRRLTTVLQRDPSHGAAAALRREIA